MIVRMFELIIFLFQKQNLSPRVTGPPEPDPKRRNPATNGRTRRAEEDGEVDTTSTARAGARLRAGSGWGDHSFGGSSFFAAIRTSGQLRG